MPRLSCCFSGVGDVDGGAFDVFQAVSLEELQSLIKTDEEKQKLVVVYCYVDKCGACKEMKEKLRKVVAENKDDNKGGVLRFVGMEVGGNAEVKKSLGVSFVPTFKLYHAGGLMETVNHDAELREVIRNFKLEKGIKPAGGEIRNVEADSSVTGAGSALTGRSFHCECDEF